MVCCCVYGCSNRPERGNVSFHKFPVDPELRSLWVKAVNRKNWMPSSYTRICSDHFAPSDLNKTYKSGRAHLRDGVIPKIFPGHFQRSTRNYSKEYKRNRQKCKTQNEENNDETFDNNGTKIKVEPGLVDNVCWEEEKYTMLGLKENSEQLDPMLDVGDTSFIKKEDGNSQNTNIKIKVEPGLTNSDFQSLKPDIDYVERCNQSEGVSIDSKINTEGVTLANKCQIIGIICAQSNFFQMSMIREDCRVFGEFVARELQKLKSDDSRTRLKEIIQRVIVEVSEADSKS